MDDCGGTFPDDASRDLAIVVLNKDVPLARVPVPYPFVYLASDMEDRAYSGWLTGPFVIAGYGGTEASGDEGTLMVGDLALVGWDTDNWATAPRAAGSWVSVQGWG